MSKRFTLWPVLLLALSLSLNGQSYSELGLSIGGIGYQGDLVDPPYSLKLTQPAVGLSYRLVLTSKYAVTANLLYGNLKGDDLAFEDVAYRQARGLQMEAQLYEFAANFEYHFLGKDSRIYRYNVYDKFFSPYIGIGAGIVYAPKEVSVADNKGEFLRVAIPEEGDRDVFFILPIRIGLRYDFSRHWAVSVEVGSRPVFSDLLDGVSRNGRSDTNDWYQHFALGVHYVFGGLE